MNNCVKKFWVETQTSNVLYLGFVKPKQKLYIYWKLIVCLNMHWRYICDRYDDTRKGKENSLLCVQNVINRQIKCKQTTFDK